MLGLLTGNALLKILLRMRMTKTFGPLVQMIIKMTFDLLEFIIFWIFIILTFTCVGSLLWGQYSEPFRAEFFDVVYRFFQVGLGSWETSIYAGIDIHGTKI